MARNADEFEAVRIEGTLAPAPVVFLCEHASCHVPEAFGDLGLTPELLRSHIAWDPGALSVARRLAAAVGAPLVAGGVSRLLYDCNRPPAAPDSIPEISEIHAIPGNALLDVAARRQRVERIYRPFCAAVERVMDAVRPQALVTVHSFTPVYCGRRRTVELGVLHERDARLADALIAESRTIGLEVARNQPYGPGDGVMHSLRSYGIARGVLNVMLEIRNDLIADAAGEARIASLLGPPLAEALADCGVRLREAL